MATTYKKKITGEVPGQFEGTKAAFADLISRPGWYKGVLIDGFPISQSNASQIKLKFAGKARKGMSQDYMESILIAAGYKIVQPIVWQK